MGPLAHGGGIAVAAARQPRSNRSGRCHRPRQTAVGNAPATGPQSASTCPTALCPAAFHYHSSHQQHSLANPGCIAGATVAGDGMVSLEADYWLWSMVSSGEDEAVS